VDSVRHASKALYRFIYGIVVMYFDFAFLALFPCDFFIFFYFLVMHIYKEGEETKLFFSYCLLPILQ